MNRKIVVAVIVISSAGVANAWLRKKPITSIVIGSYILLFVLSIMDMFGGPLSTLSGAIAMVAVVAVLLDPNIFPWGSILNALRGVKNTTPTKTSSTTNFSGINPGAMFL